VWYEFSFGGGAISLSLLGTIHIKGRISSQLGASILVGCILEEVGCILEELGTFLRGLGASLRSGNKVWGHRSFPYSPRASGGTLSEGKGCDFPLWQPLWERATLFTYQRGTNYFYQGAFAECWSILPRVDFLSPVAAHSGRLKLDRGLYELRELGSSSV
jgi:hypothetical protein